MKHVNLVVTVGRALPQALATFDYAKPEDAELGCDAVQSRKVGELLAAGVALKRVSFERVYVDTEDCDAKGNPRAQPPRFASKKGK